MEKQPMHVLWLLLVAYFMKSHSGSEAILMVLKLF